MNTDYLRYFSTLAELQHYGKAAKELNISQPGLSHAIHSLEKDYGLPLFEKTGRNVRLSPYGLEIKKYIDIILNNLDELEQTISDFHREDKIIRIASVYPLAGSFIPELIQSCSVKFPFAIYNGMTPDILHGLETMTYDLGFCSGHPFRDITTYPQIFFTRTSPMRKLQEQIYKDYQISAAPACEAEEIEVILNMIEHGFGISVLPYLDIFKNRNVDVLPLSEAKWESTFYAIRRRDGVRSHGEKTIWSQIIHNSKRDRLEF